VDRGGANAAFFGFTGTPIDEKDRSTLSTFGSHIDTYTIEPAVADGTAGPIFYEGRLPELRILGNSLDAIVDRVFKDRTDEEREVIKKLAGTGASRSTIQLGPPHANLGVRCNHEAPDPALDVLCPEETLDVVLESPPAWIRKADEEEPVVCSRGKLSHIREIEILRDKEPLVRLSRCPYVGVG
jgi:SWI2/SNF2 ATPase